MNFGLGDSQMVEFSPALPIPRRVLFSDEPCWLVSKPIGRSRKHRSALIPDDLLMMEEANPQQPVQHFASELGRMPHVRHLETRHELERLRPVGSRVAGDRGLGVTLRAALHVRRLGRAVLVDSSSVPPFRIQFDSVRRICHHQPRLAFAEQAARPLRPTSHRHTVRDARRTATGRPASSPRFPAAAERDLLCSHPSDRAATSSSSCTSNPGQAEIESAHHKARRVPAPAARSSHSSFFVRTVVHQAKTPHLRRRQVAGHVHRHFVQPQRLRGCKPEVADDDHVVDVDHDRLTKSIRADARRDFIDRLRRSTCARSWDTVLGGRSATFRLSISSQM